MKRVVDFSTNRRSLLRSLRIALLLVLFIGATFLPFDYHQTSNLQLADTTTTTGTGTKVPYSDTNPMPPVSWCPGCSS
ncbi:MAG: hypothetical protein U0350_07295 [Caldilineaceae bacterium]